jgi:hypothetical protein
MGPARVGDRRRPFRVAFAFVLAVQLFLAVLGIADQWTRGHNGWNGAAYQNAARNTLRWDVLFPLQYETANVPPRPERLYTHAPLGLHMHNVVSVKIFGDHEASIRGVAAFWSVAALCMLFAVVRRLWDEPRALAAAAVYVALPINAIYTNMANHSSGFIFWSLLTCYLYLRAPHTAPRPWLSFVLLLATFTMSATWDWPAYYVAACIAAHWAWSLVRRRDASGTRTDAVQLVAFCAWVVFIFASHFVLVELLTGNLDELSGTFNARRALSLASFQTHLLLVPALMFTTPVLGLCAAWAFAWVGRAWIGYARGRDLIPLAFLFAGLVHYWTFRWSAVAHSYWAWPLLPAAAIIVSVSLFATARWLRERVGLAASLGVLLLLLPLALRVVQIVPEGRHVGGSMWFFTPVRGAIEPYDSGRQELRLARQVKGWTRRETGVQLHTSMKSRRLEPRFDITLDRATHRWSQKPRQKIRNRKGVSEWVFVAAVEAFTKDERAAMAALHPYRQFGDYFMLDLRRDEIDIQISQLTPYSPGPRWWLLHSPFEPPVRVSRVVTAEQSLRKKAMELDAP